MLTTANYPNNANGSNTANRPNPVYNPELARVLKGIASSTDKAVEDALTIFRRS